MYWPFGSSLVNGPPGWRTISRTGLPVISTMRPPTWNEPMPRSTMSSFANAGSATLTAAAIKAKRIIPSPVFVGALSPICRHVATVGNAIDAARVGRVPFTPNCLRVRSRERKCAALEPMLQQFCCRQRADRRKRILSTIVPRIWDNRGCLNLQRGARMLGLATVLLLASSIATAVAQAPATIRVGHFPNITHVQALVAQQLRAAGQRLVRRAARPGVKIEWYAYNAGPSAMEAIFADTLDLTYVGPNPAINAYARSRGEEIRIVAGAVNGGSALVVQPDRASSKPADFRGKRIATPQFGNTQDVAARAWLASGGLRITQTGGDAQVLPTANPDQLGAVPAQAARCGVDGRAVGVAPRARGRRQVLVEEKDAVTTVLAASASFSPRSAIWCAASSRRTAS